MAKKSFKTATAKDNPAVSYISAPATQPEIRSTTDASAETKSKRVNLLLRPSVYRQIEKLAAMQRTSPNDLINTILASYAEQERDTIAKYNEIFGEV